MMTSLSPTPEIDEALARHGLRPRRIALVSPLGELKGRRLAYRVETEDGGTCKVRQFESPDVARQNFELRTGLEETFAPALARYGPVLVEAWVDGVPLSLVDAAERAEEAGALLGRLHARRTGVPSTTGTERWRQGAESDLEILAASGRLSPSDDAVVRDALRSRDPGVAPAALAHMDFCAENMVVDPRGCLRVIDNEQLSIEPAGLDLARAFERWPMPEPVWARFSRGYRSTAPVEPGSTGFWRLVAALLAARVYLHRSPERCETALELLGRLIRGDRLSERQCNA